MPHTSLHLIARVVWMQHPSVPVLLQLRADARQQNVVCTFECAPKAVPGPDVRKISIASRTF